MAIYVPYAISVGGVVIGGITQGDIRRGTTTGGGPTSGEALTRFRYLSEQKPGADHTTTAIATAIAKVTALGYAITDDVLFYQAQVTEGASIAAGSVHRKHTVKKGLIVPGTLTAEHRQDATLTLTTSATSDDAINDPMALAESQALPTAFADTEKYTLGSVQVGAKTLTSFRNVTVDFGVQAQSEGSQSNLWDVLTWVPDYNPSIKISGIDPSWISAANIPLTALDASHANTIIKLYKRAAGGPDSSAYVQITAAGLAYSTQQFQGQQGNAATCELTIDTVFDATNHPILITVV